MALPATPTPPAPMAFFRATTLSIGAINQNGLPS
jgi:hypothetical protein